MTGTNTTDPTMLKTYHPGALYYAEADMVEYLREDVLGAYRRVDDSLTLIVDMRDKRPIGFTIKGFRNFYLRSIKPIYEKLGYAERDEKFFLSLVGILEHLVKQFGDDAEWETARRDAYKVAFELARDENAKLEDIPFSDAA